ncbi:MAG: histidine phosphatase family protein [Nocardioides sp.]
MGAVQQEPGRLRRRLAVMRHAKAEGYEKADHERELAPRGRVDAEATGQWLAELGMVPDGALVSAAARSRQTWQGVAGAAGWTVDAEHSEALYVAGPESALDLIRETSDDVTILVVVGHNPTMAYVAQLLDDGEGEHTSEMALGFPTSTVAVFEFEGDWAELPEAGCRLVGFSVPRG